MSSISGVSEIQGLKEVRDDGGEAPLEMAGEGQVEKAQRGELFNCLCLTQCLVQLRHFWMIPACRLALMAEGVEEGRGERGEERGGEQRRTELQEERVK